MFIAVCFSQTNKIITTAEDHHGHINDMQACKDGTMFITASKDTTSKLFDTETLECLKTYKTERPVNSACISPNLEHVSHDLLASPKA